MRKIVAIWLVAFVLFWSTLLVTFLVDYLGVIEASNLGFVETTWISWMLWTVILGLGLVVLTYFVERK
jgi:hypothetical protein